MCHKHKNGLAVVARSLQTILVVLVSENLESIVRIMKILRPEEIINFPEIGHLGADELKAAYALADAAFTAADLQRYTEIEEGVSAEDVLREPEETQKQLDAEKPR